VINAPRLLADLTKQLKTLEADLRQRIADLPDLRASLEAEWQAAAEAKRTNEPFKSWADQVITQAGVHWLLSCTFLRFVEDNGLVDRPWLGGTPESGRLALARDRHDAYFREHPAETDREYLLHCFREAGTLPGLRTFFDERHNPVFRLAPSGDAAMALRNFWQQINPDTGALQHDFTDASWNTRFLGDLYQDLSEATRKRYALLQTPEFVEEFILDRTLTPAIRTFGFREVRMIDPTCGSGHFLLGGFARLVAEWQRAEPGRNPRDVTQKALDAVAGVDLNPFAVAISRFRLLVAALQAAGVPRLAGAPDFQIRVAIGDSLLHGQRFGLGGQTATRSEQLFDEAQAHAGEGLEHAYATEDLTQVKQILGRQYHAVVGNPPYIVVKDAALNAAYRKRYASCHMKYSLGCPFTERFFELAVTGERYGQAGYVGLITANSFMKREFGSKLIEQVLPRLDLTHVIDTSGAYIPGHGTPTVILLGCHRPPHDELNSASNTVRVVMGIKGEPTTPDDPAHGLVWSAIVDQIDRPGSEGEFVSCTDTPRATFGKHPWSIGGGGAADVKELIESGSSSTMGSISQEMGVFGMTNADEVMLAPASAFRRFNVESDYRRPLIVGDMVRDWVVPTMEEVLFPYKAGTVVPLKDAPKLADWVWASRTVLGNRATFGKSTYFEEGRPWWAWHQVALRRIESPLTITFAEIATHNHFVLDRGGKVFKQTAPVIKLPAGSSEDEHLGLLGLLNSSVVGFWLKQVCHQKQMMGGDGIRISEKSKVPYQFASTRVQELPIPANWANHVDRPRLIELARQADSLAASMAANAANHVVRRGVETGLPLKPLWDKAVAARKAARAQLILIQEEIDFLVYGMYGLVTDRQLLASRLDWKVELEAGERPFCIVSQKNVEGFDVPAAIPAEWPDDLRVLWRRRMEAIRSNEALRVIEDPHYKRRWIGRQGLFNHGAKADEFRDALADWMLDRLEQSTLWSASADEPPQLTTTSRLADRARGDAAFTKVAALYAGHADFDVSRLVAEMVAAEAVPLLPVLRYTEDGLRKRAQWEDTWALQRREDAIDTDVLANDAPDWRTELEARARTRFTDAEASQAQAWVEEQLAAEIQRHQAERKAAEVGPIPVPPKYKSSDFLKADFWRLRGGLDVPKERFVSFPGAERGADGSLVIAWAGWNHLQLATALAGWYIHAKEDEGWPADRLQPLLAGLQELLPWLKQWHNDLDPVHNERMGDYYAGFVADEARALGFTADDLRAWKPAVVSTKRGRKRAA
jgi:hypothetical protein